MDITGYMPWLDRTETSEGLAEVWPVQGLLAALDSPGIPAQGAEAPLLAQWLYFGPTVGHSQLGPDGHPLRGGFLPPVDLPRRMWAASDIFFHAPVLLGHPLRKTARIADISARQGASGPLVFVKVSNRYEDGSDRLLLEETQTLVYRADPAPDETPPAGKPAPVSAQWSAAATPDEPMLFRYSAVTFNAHRIHYDHPYATRVEGYPGVVVQGQLLATLMLRACQAAHPRLCVQSFAFRGVQPVFAGETVFAEGVLTGQDCTLWIRDAAGNLRMSGSATVKG